MIQKLLDRSCTGVFFKACAVGDDEGGRLLHAEAQRQLRVLVRHQFFIGIARLVKIIAGDAAVRAGGGGKEDAALFAGDGRGALLRFLCGCRLDRAAAEDGVGNVVFPTLLVFLRLAGVPVLHGAVVAGDAAVDLCALAAVGAGELLADEVAVVLADGIGGRKRILRQLVVFRDLAYQICRRLPVGQLFA